MKIQRWTVQIMLGLSLGLLPGCIPFYKQSGTEIEGNRVAQIQPGVTSRREALEWFGPPMSISGRGELAVIPRASLAEKEYRVPRGPTVVEADTFFELFSPEAELTENHRVYYFYFAENKYLYYYMFLVSYDKIDTKYDKLWLLVNEKTGLVENYYFRKGI